MKAINTCVLLLAVLSTFNTGDVLAAHQGISAAKMNVILVMVDDLRAEITSFLNEKQRPWLNPHIRTPNIDELAARSLVLTSAYVQEALCNPSRTSLLTGRRPDNTGVTDNLVWFRDTGNPDIVTLSQYFKENNYTTVGIGKVFHLFADHPQDVEKSWTRFTPFHSHFIDQDIHYAWRAFPESVTKVTPLVDQLVTDDALNELVSVSEEYKTTGKPFFLTTGYRRPHLPWLFPDEFLDMYPLDKMELPLNPNAPYKMPEEAWFNSFDMISHLHKDQLSWHINSTLLPSLVKELRRAYYSCVSHVDNEIGRLMEHVKTLGLSANTVIAFLGDHGWQLGEHGIWGKHTNFEEATHAPLMISVPGLTDRGKNVTELVEFVDLFPTLVEAAGLNMPRLCPRDHPRFVDLCIEGISLIPLMKEELRWKEATFSQYPYTPLTGSEHCASMGYSMRTARYRYTEWLSYDKTEKTPKAVELFDLERDPLEQYNRAGDEEYSGIVPMLSQMLQDGWRRFIPYKT